MKKVLLFCLLLPLTLWASEEGHAEKEYLTGSGFDLVKSGDLVEGTFNGFPVIAEKKCGSHFIGKLQKNELERGFTVTYVNGKLVGDFAGKQLAYAGYDKTNQNIMVKVDNTVIPVHFTAEDFADGHNIGVTFTFTYRFKEYTVHLDGEACMSSMTFYALFLVGIVGL